MGSGSVLGFDFGLKRIGVAVGTLELKLAHPLETIAIETTDARFARIGKLIEEWQPALAVVGIPRRDDGTHEFAPTCLRFAQRLKGRFGLNVALVDESYSSAAASSALNESGIRGRQQKSMLDQVAAQHILQHYFDEPDHAHHYLA
ncbi:putative pre-16S rRNA nuclease [Sulfuriferula plumbiphila]|uniref:Putative pre-16S rRNA nuclease n=1 Tax=Sulfuriferula plumbiphila TaxID=171865 RepID=A0A512L368_9PROT|nr:Holliday junction resolvase RuvX [Sulfuriferula plumbiphila]BBP02623.1 putative pre-16S rRNA nuclease [Sulfuriferula plumbiphila]GEP28917.1 putative pre-16S rRNA nuclease [Sulfuriferula plumbiphila]